MKIYFQYNSKSRGQNIPRAHQIAEELGYETEHNFSKYKKMEDSVKSRAEILSNEHYNEEMIDNNEPLKEKIKEMILKIKSIELEKEGNKSSLHRFC